ncbi:MAG: hypothetical protein L6R00_20330 [Phycisphaerae bacterium]|nr:hypothetical protein [Phycisphaerae bacterium]
MKETSMTLMPRWQFVPGVTGFVSQIRPAHDPVRNIHTILAIATVFFLGGGCVVDVGTFYRQDVVMRVVSATTGEPVQGALVALTWPAQADSASPTRARTAVSDNDGLARIELKLVECFRSIISLIPCEVSEDGALGRSINIEVSLDEARLNGVLTLMPEYALDNESFVVTVIEVSAPRRDGGWQ